MVKIGVYIEAFVEFVPQRTIFWVNAVGVKLISFMLEHERNEGDLTANVTW